MSVTFRWEDMVLWRGGPSQRHGTPTRCAGVPPPPCEVGGHLLCPALIGASASWVRGGSDAAASPGQGQPFLRGDQSCALNDIPEPACQLEGLLRLKFGFNLRHELP